MGKILPSWSGVSDFTLMIRCLRFYYFTPFKVFDSFSHLFLPCQWLYTFCKLLDKKNLPSFDQILWKVAQENVRCGSNKFLQVFIAVVVAYTDTGSPGRLKMQSYHVAPVVALLCLMLADCEDICALYGGTLFHIITYL